MAAPIETLYTSCACNRVPHCVHWGPNGLLAFGTCNSVALYEPESPDSAGRVSCLLRGHKGKVNCVKWLECPSVQQTKSLVPTELVSGSQDGAVLVWRCVDGQYEQCGQLTGHTAAVTALEAVSLPDAEGQLSASSRTLVASASGDSTVRLWARPGLAAEFSPLQSIGLGNGFALDIAVSILPGTGVPLLALVGDDTKVHLHAETDGQFAKCLPLAGHEDWIRGVEMTVDDTGDILMATCSQDCFIRLWRIARAAGDSSETQDSTGELRLRRNRFSMPWEGGEVCFSVVLESVLAGHEQWVYGVHWQAATYKDGIRHQPLRLLSASMDKTMIIWEMDKESGVWLDHVRVGEVGGNTLGLYGCQFSPEGSAILAHGFQGAFHLWTRHRADAKNSRADQWSPSPVVSGHFAGVQDIAWDPAGGEFLLSAGLDQTTRLHAPWRRDGFKTTWHEIARPQVHGYDMQCLTLVNRYRLASGADEKVLRVFDAPRNFIENFGRIASVDVKQALHERASDGPEGASVPALGLSNKAIFQGDASMPASGREISHPSEMYPEIYFSPLELAAPPTEEHLLQNTLWPEMQKLYGHSYEIFSITSHPGGALIASACKASKAEYATILLWDTSTWRQAGQLSVHSLTVTQLAFSHTGQHLLAVSRDRTWSLFRERPSHTRQSSDCPYELVANTDKKTALHTRIIWSCAWSHDDLFFATASRDKKVIVWGQRSSGQDAEPAVTGDYRARSVPLDLREAVTAVDFAPVLCSEKGSYLLAAGLDSGLVSILKWHSDEPTVWQTCLQLQPNLCHTMTVKRLRWRPAVTEAVSEEAVSGRRSRLQLASCSADGSVRIHSVECSSL